MLSLSYPDRVNQGVKKHCQCDDYNFYLHQIRYISFDLAASNKIR